MRPLRAAGHLPLAVVLSGVLLSGCGQDVDDRPLQDGTFSGTSEPDEQGASAQVTVTVADGDVVDVEFVTVQADGSLKDEDYGTASDGQVANEDYYRRAQAAVDAFEVYAAQLVDVDDPGEVDVIAGATISHRQFVEAANEALTASRDAAENGQG